MTLTDAEIIAFKKETEIELEWQTSLFEDVKQSNSEVLFDQLLEESSVPLARRKTLKSLFFYLVGRNLMSARSFARDLICTKELGDWHSSASAEEVYYIVDLFTVMTESTKLPISVLNIHGHVSILFDDLVWNVNPGKGFSLWTHNKLGDEGNLIAFIPKNEVPSISSLYQMLTRYLQKS